MSERKFGGIEACVFDAYGTLFDFNTAAERSRDALGDKADRLSEIWRQKQLQYTWLRSLMGRYTDFWEVTGEALDHAMNVVEIDNSDLRAELMQHYLSCDAYPDAADTLRKLKQSKLKTAILSNGSPTMLLSAVKSAGLSDTLDALLSADSVGVYKPHPTVYQLAVDQFKVSPSAICFMSSNGWDAYGAATFGFQVAWVNRTRQPPENIPTSPHIQLSNLAELPELLGI